MAENSKIEWTDHTFNPWIGCTRVSLGCDGCYAAVSTPARAMKVTWGVNEPRHRTAESTWKQPVKWERGHAAFFAEHGRRQRVFCASLADVFDNAVPVEWRVDLFRLIAATPNLDWLLLTKRIGNAWPMMQEVAKRCGGGEQPMENIWLGATVVNQEEADRDIPKLLAVPARVRFLSVEPLLGPVDLSRVMAITHNAPVNVLRPKGCAQHAPGYCLGNCPWRWRGVDWVIVGGESGPGARPMNPQWAREIRDQCAAAGVAFLHKQNGEFASVSEVEGPGAHHTFPDGETVRRVGKKAAGRLLDGAQHDGFPL